MYLFILYDVPKHCTLKGITYQRGDIMPFIDVHQKKIFYEESGNEHSGIPILFIHGGGGNHCIWTEHLRALGETRHVVALDLPGHDQSEGPACSSIREYADWVCEFISSYFRHQKPVLIGHSMGGAIVQQIAADGFEKMCGIVIVSSGAKLEIPPEFMEQVRKGQISQEAFVAGFSPQTSESVLHKVGSCLARTAMESTISDFEALNQYDLRKPIKHIHVPALIMVGADDVLTPLNYSEMLHQSIPDSLLTVVPAAGHYVVIEQPEAFQNLIKQFVENLDQE
jgi:pimeloyl-ACP methyl ester carboxylesterase